AYAKKVFSQSTLVEKFIELPAGIRKRLSEISYGIAGIESGFNNSLISPVKAQSVWQIMPSTFEQICEKLDLKVDYDNFITTTAVANRYCEEIYDYLRRFCHDDFKSLATEFGFSKTDFENEFIFPCIVSAYHAGYGRLKKVIHWFAENYDQDRLCQKIGTYPLTEVKTLTQT
ncbi:Lytic transglycosylase-like, catalytic domain protein, partial [Candidatus Thiomargarita nelsonii]